MSCNLPTIKEEVDDGSYELQAGISPSSDNGWSQPVVMQLVVPVVKMEVTNEPDSLAPETPVDSEAKHVLDWFEETLKNIDGSVLDLNVGKSKEQIHQQKIRDQTERLKIGKRYANGMDIIYHLFPDGAMPANYIRTRACSCKSRPKPYTKSKNICDVSNELKKSSNMFMLNRERTLKKLHVGDIHNYFGSVCEETLEHLVYQQEIEDVKLSIQEFRDSESRQ